MSENIKDNINWVNDIPDPLPGMYYIEPPLEVNFKDHDPCLEEVLPPTIYTDPLDLLNIDFMKIALDDLCRENIQEEKKSNMSFNKEYDYDKYIKNSFNDVNEYEHPINKDIKVKNVYDVFRGDDTKYWLIQTNNEESINSNETYNIKDSMSSNIYKYLESNDKTYEGIRCTNSDYMIMCVKDGKIYYYDIDCVFKCKTVKKKAD